MGPRNPSRSLRLVITRIWRAPFQVNGGMALGRSCDARHRVRARQTQQRHHAQDRSNIDFEREFLEATLTGTGLVAEFTYFLPDNPLREAKTATGGGFHSDGRVLILKLADSASTPAPAPATTLAR